jgi:hypothetical protein
VSVRPLCPSITRGIDFFTVLCGLYIQIEVKIITARLRSVSDYWLDTLGIWVLGSFHCQEP